MPVTFSSYRLGPGQRVSYKTVPPPWDWLIRRENELEPRRSRSQIIFAVLVPPLYVAVQAPALIVTKVRGSCKTQTESPLVRTNSGAETNPIGYVTHAVVVLKLYIVCLTDHHGLFWAFDTRVDEACASMHEPWKKLGFRKFDWMF